MSPRWIAPDIRLISQPVPVHWRGWSSTTQQLQAAGWELSAHQDIQTCMMRLAIRHAASRASGYSQGIPWEYYHDYQHHQSFPAVHFECMGSPDLFVRHDGPSPFVAIDAQPRWERINFDSKMSPLEAFGHFAGARAGEKIILPEENVNEMLTRILEMQQAAKTQHFMERVKAAERGYEPGVDIDSVPHSEFKAQIISLADRRAA